MPQLRGAELATLVGRFHPGAVVVFMSGYSREVLLESGLLHEEAVVMQKPFEPEALVTKIRELLRGVQHGVR
jgi:DNA-binding response OmpR family regulator